MHCVPRFRLLRTASFRLAATYLLLFTLSALALGAFVSFAVLREIRAGFDDRILEETAAMDRVFNDGGREKLMAILAARGSGGGSLAYGLAGPDGSHLGGDLVAPDGAPPRLGWTEMHEVDSDDMVESAPEVLRVLTTPLSDGSYLMVGDERRRISGAIRSVVVAFGWAVAATLVLGAIGGLYLSRRFLRRIDAMRAVAQGIMAGDWGRRIPQSSVDDDLAALARTFNRLFDRIEKLLIANKHVSAEIAHDLRKPLARILRRLETARGEEALASARNQAIGEAIGDIEGVLETFDALLRIGQIEAGARRAAFRPVDLGKIAREVVEAFAPAAEEVGKTIIARLDSPLPLAGDKDLLKQMIANLIDNAVRHGAAGARIEVSGERKPKGFLIRVSDDGPGVAAQDLARVFDRFYRGARAVGVAGSGLGLSLVAAIADLHDLEVVAADNLPGLRVTIETRNAPA
jgi:signal transduction histidine kinase